MTFAISMSLINLGLYCIQQLGVTLAVGAETILLVAYLQAVRDGVVDDEEKGFARAVRSVKDFGLFFIIISGGALVAQQFFTGQLNEFLSIVVLFKWSLIGIALFLGFVRGSGLVTGLIQGLSAGTWYALFAVHILAPEAPWQELTTFYGIWLVGFALCWTILVFSLRNRKPAPVTFTAHPTSALPKSAVVITPNRVAPVTQTIPKAEPVKPNPAPIAPPITVTMPKPPPAAPPAPPAAAAIPVPPPPAPPPSRTAAATAPAEWLQVMPRTPEDAAKHKPQ